MFLYWLMFALVFGYPQQESPKPEELTAARREASPRYERFRQESIRVNELAAHIGSEADARAYVDAVADMFADSLPPSWTMPNVFAVGADGKVAEGCRAVEALRVVHDLDQQFDNLRGARERLRQGIVASDAIKKSLENTKASQKTTARLTPRVDTNPLRRAEYRYVHEHGADHLNQVVAMLFEELFPANQQARSTV